MSYALLGPEYVDGYAGKGGHKVIRGKRTAKTSPPRAPSLATHPPIPSPSRHRTPPSEREIAASIDDDLATAEWDAPSPGGATPKPITVQFADPPTASMRSTGVEGEGAEVATNNVDQQVETNGLVSWNEVQASVRAVSLPEKRRKRSTGSPSSTSHQSSAVQSPTAKDEPAPREEVGPAIWGEMFNGVEEDTLWEDTNMDEGSRAPLCIINPGVEGDEGSGGVTSPDDDHGDDEVYEEGTPIPLFQVHRRTDIICSQRLFHDSPLTKQRDSWPGEERDEPQEVDDRTQQSERQPGKGNAMTSGDETSPVDPHVAMREALLEELLKGPVDSDADDSDEDEGFAVHRAPSPWRFRDTQTPEPEKQPEETSDASMLKNGLDVRLARDPVKVQMDAAAVDDVDHLVSEYERRQLETDTFEWQLHLRRKGSDDAGRAKRSLNYWSPMRQKRPPFVVDGASPLPPALQELHADGEQQLRLKSGASSANPSRQGSPLRRADAIGSPDDERAALGRFTNILEEMLHSQQAADSADRDIWSQKPASPAEKEARFTKTSPTTTTTSRTSGIPEISVSKGSPIKPIIKSSSISPSAQAAAASKSASPPSIWATPSAAAVVFPSSNPSAPVSSPPMSSSAAAFTQVRNNVASTRSAVVAPSHPMYQYQHHEDVPPREPELTFRHLTSPSYEEVSSPSPGTRSRRTTGYSEAGSTGGSVAAQPKTVSIAPLSTIQANRLIDPIPHVDPTYLGYWSGAANSRSPSRVSSATSSVKRRRQLPLMPPARE